MTRAPGPTPHGPFLSDVDAEIRHHLLEAAEHLMAEGWSEEDAAREAERRFGDRERIRDELAAVARGGGSGGGPPWGGRPAARIGEMLRSTASDLRHALRSLKAQPSFAITVVATLALGIGAAVSIFAIVDALLLRPMPYSEPDRWVEVNQAREESGYTPGLRADRVDAWRAAGEGVFDAWVLYHHTEVVRTDGATAEPLTVVGVSPGAERHLGIPVLRGRGFTAEDARPGSPPVALVSEAYWRRGGSDPTMVGRTLRLETGPATVVGVVSSEILFPPGDSRPELWVPIRDDFTFLDRSPGGVQGLWARLAPGVTLDAGQERADALAASLMERQPEEQTWRVALVPVGARRATPDTRLALWMLSGTVATIFLIALVNGMNLLLVRASTRVHEIAVRTALGASRRRLIRQFLAEGVVLGLSGGLAAVALAVGSVRVIREIVPSSVLFFGPYVFEVEGRTLLFAFLTSLLAGIALGLLPALQLLSRRPSGAMRGSGIAEEPPARRRLRRGLVVAQISLSMALLVGAGLFVNGFVRLMSVDPGFEYQRLAIADLMASPTRYPDGPARWELAQRLEAALEARPEIAAVSVETGGGFSFDVTLEAEGQPPREDQPSLVPQGMVAPDYLTTMGMDLVAGRDFGTSDAGTDNAVVDRDMSRFLFGNADPIGRRFRLEPESPWLTIVGVVDELRMMGRDQRDGPYQYLQVSEPGVSYGYLEFAMRTSGPPEALLPIFEQTLRSIDPEQSYWRLRTGAQALAEEEEQPRFLVTLMSTLAALAVTLASVGLYGVLAYSVTRRHREIGVRMALGAAGSRVRMMMLAEGMGLAVIGVVLGLLAAFWLVRTVESLLYEVDPRDAGTWAVTAVLLLGVASLASLLPARRATRVDPVEALRAE